MHLVDNINFKPSLRRRIGHLIHNLTDVVNAIVGGGVNLNHIHTDARRNRLTARTFPTRTPLHRVLAVHRPRKYFRYGSLSCSPRPAEEIRVTDTVRLDLVLQGGHYMLLPFDILKTARAELTIQCCI